MLAPVVKLMGRAAWPTLMGRSDKEEYVTMGSEGKFDNICYKRNFLTEVIARLDLVSPIESLGKDLPKAIAAESLRHFPISEPQPIQARELQVSKEEVKSKTKEFTEWNFFGREREKRLTFGPQTFLISYGRYQQYETLRGEFESIVKVFFENYSEAQPSRLGLRYVNEVKLGEGDPLQWEDYISKDLLGMFSFNAKGAEAARIFHNLEFVYGKSDFNVRFRFGMHNPDYPAPIRQRVFILDFDAYCQGLLETQVIPILLDKYHAAIQELFERSITDKAREVLNGTK
jgi:uncharacterized protein (TIGR04255 family)